MNALTKNFMLRTMLSGLSFFCLPSLTNTLFAQNDLFSEVALETTELTENQARILNRLQQDQTTIDLKVVQVNKEFLVTGQSINLNLFPGERFTASTDKINQRSDKDFTWYGSIPGKESNILLSVYKNSVTGFMIIEEQGYNLRSLGDGLNAIIRVDPTQYPLCGNIPVNNGEQAGQTGSTAFPETQPGSTKHNFLPGNAFESAPAGANTLNAGNTVIKVLVAYTPAARSEAGTVNDILNEINLAISAANQSYGLIPIELQLAHTVEVTYTESSATEPPVSIECDGVISERYRLTVLARFQDPSDGFMDEIHDLRALSAADVAVLITASNIGVCGQAFEIGATASEAFCVVEISCVAAAQQWSFAHEIGHLFGARHEPTADDCNSPFSYGHGFKTIDNKWQTMMGIHENATRIQNWSNTSLFHQGYRMGNTTFSFAARVLGEQASYVANFAQEGGTIVINNDVTVGNNSTLNIAAATTIKFTPNTGLIVNGTCNVSGTSSAPVTFTRSGGSGTWDGIRFQNGSSGSITHAAIDYAETGIYCDNAYPTIASNSISNNSNHGIYLYYASPAITSNTITQNTYGITGNHANSRITNNTISNNVYGIWLPYTSVPNLNDNTIESNSSYGIYAYYSSPRLGPTSGSGKGNNVVKNNGHGIYAKWNCQPFLGSETSGNRVGGYNTLGNNSYYNTRAVSNVHIAAQYNWWGQSPPSTSKISADGTSSIDYSNYLTSDPGGGASLLVHESGTVVHAAVFSAEYSFSSTPPDTNSLAALWVWAKDAWLTGKSQEAIDTYKIIVRKFPGAPEAKQALLQIVFLHKESKTAGLRNYLSNMAGKSGVPPGLNQVSLDFLVGEYVEKGDLNQAISTCDRIIQKYVGAESEILALFNLFNIYHKDLKNQRQAKETLAVMKQKYPKHELTLMAQLDMGEKAALSYSGTRTEQKLKEDTIEALISETANAIPEKYSLEQNYPNPFNPTTTIRYQLPEEAFVRLGIYNLLGQRVRALFAGRQNAGFRQARWDGKNDFGQPVASGVYIVRLQAGSFVESIKTALVR